MNSCGVAEQVRRHNNKILYITLGTYFRKSFATFLKKKNIYSGLKFEKRNINTNPSASNAIRVDEIALNKPSVVDAMMRNTHASGGSGLGGFSESFVSDGLSFPLLLVIWGKRKKLNFSTTTYSYIICDCAVALTYQTVSRNYPILENNRIT